MLIVPINSSGFAMFDRLNGLLSALCRIFCYGIMLGDHIVMSTGSFVANNQFPQS